MSSDYTEETEYHSYTAYLEMGMVDPDTMTDAGCLASELEPIRDAMLSPGDPSTLGRTPDGQIAYPVIPDETHMRLKRRGAAYLAALLAAREGITEMPEPPFEDGPVLLLAQLMREALPVDLYPDSSHGQITRDRDEAAILAGDLETPAHLWVTPD